MSDIPTGAQVFDISFHPNESIVFAGLLTGGIKAFGYDEQGQSVEKFSIRPSKKSCRGLATNEDGSHLYAVGKAKAMHTIDTATGRVVDTRTAIHSAPVNRIKYLHSWLLCTGDDDGVVKLWDPRKSEEIRSYDHHFDFISDFMWTEAKKELVVTSGDGTLSVIDVRSKKTVPVAQSEDQEDELLSIAPIRGGEKTVVGTQQGVLSIFNRSSGWGDCVDRVPGHPHSIDALCTLPSSYPSSHSTLLTGSSDGLLRAVQLFPTKLLGVVADHGEFPIERIAVDRGGEGQWVGSVGHDEVIKLTDLKEVFEDEDKDEDKDEGEGEGEEGEDNSEGEDKDEEGNEDEDGKVEAVGDGDDIDDEEGPKGVNERKDKGGFAVGSRNGSDSSDAEKQKQTPVQERSDDDDDDDADDDDDSDKELQKKKRRKKTRAQDLLATEKKKKRKARNDEVSADPSFFADL